MPRASLSGRLRTLLADGEERTFLELYAAVRDIIPPESAVRGYAAKYAGRAPPEVRVEIGRRTRVRNALRNIGARFDGADEAQTVRLPGGVATWPYSANRDQEKHRASHLREQQKKRDLRAAARAGYLRPGVYDQDRSAGLRPAEEGAGGGSADRAVRTA